MALPSPDDRTLISNSWKRCTESYGLDRSQRISTKVLSSTQFSERRDRMGHLLDTANDEMLQLLQAVGKSGYAMLLTDRNGIIIQNVCDPDYGPDFRHAGLWNGADWGEERQGTNGIGTCIAENRPVTVHLSDHFFRCNSGLTCTAAPIFDPTGQILGVLDASSCRSSDSRRSQIHLRALICMSATQLSNNHFLWEYRKSLVLRFHTRYEYVGLFNEGLIALDDEGRILAANDSAVGMLGYPGRKDLVNRKIHEVVDVTMDRLLASVRTSVSTVWPMHEMIGGHQFFAMACSAQADWLPGASAVRDVSPADSQLTLADVGGSDPQMMRLADTARRVADKKIPILLLGETGTGKEVLARAIHAASDRADQAFVTLNCSALSESVIESELFGYTHGTFTGARRKEFKGRLILSDGGTIFLDEIGDMPAQLQSRLLRVLEDGVVTPLGSDRAVKVELNVISATNKSLEKMIADGRFRADLYYRLGGVCLSLAPLRARTDCGELIRKIVAAESRLGRVPSISAEALERLSCQSWPGNIRQLRHAVKAALALCEGNELLASDFAAACPSGPARALVLPADEASSGRGGEAAGDAAGPDPLALAERHAIVHALQCANGNVSKAARELSISRNTLYRKLKRHDIDLASMV